MKRKVNQLDYFPKAMVYTHGLLKQENFMTLDAFLLLFPKLERESQVQHYLKEFTRNSFSQTENYL